MAASPITSAPSHAGRNSIIALLVLAGVAWASSPWWWSAALAWWMGGSAADAKHEAAERKELTMLELTDEARKTLNIAVGVLKPSTYERVIPVPGRTITIPGTGRHQVTAASSGVVKQVFVNQGELVARGQMLFEIQLIHDEGIETQVQLLDALADKEVVQVEVERLEQLEARTPGAVPGTRLLEKRYELRHLNHLIASRRQMLILLGLSSIDVDDMIKTHLEREQQMPAEEHTDFRHPLLLDKVMVKAPPAMGNDPQSRFLLEKLHVVVGQHIDVGDMLCQLGDYSTLWIEGEAFERDLEAIRQARDKAWPVTVAVERRGRAPLVLKSLTIRDLAPQVDVAAGAAGFYVELPNELRAIPTASGESERIDWVFRPGQRVEIRVPTQLMEHVLVVPVQAVAQDGLNNYVFQVNGNIVNRRPVQVLERDEDFVVIAETRFVTTGVQIALNGAFQLQLALLNKSIDPAAIAHGHAH